MLRMYQRVLISAFPDWVSSYFLDPIQIIINNKGMKRRTKEKQEQKARRDEERKRSERKETKERNKEGKEKKKIGTIGVK